MLFAISCLCQWGLSTIFIMKRKYRRKANVEVELRKSLFTMKPRLSKFRKSKQENLSLAKYSTKFVCSSHHSEQESYLIMMWILALYFFV
jgi:hypothetical protein